MPDDGVKRFDMCNDKTTYTKKQINCRKKQERLCDQNKKSS